MDRKNIYLLTLVPLIFCIFFILPPHIGEPASIKTTLDAKYSHRDSTQQDSRSKENEYNPRLSVKYSHPLTQWTNLSGEAKFDYKKIDKSGEEDTETTKDTETREPQIEFRLKSLIYDFKAGFKETWNKDESTENRAFGHLLIQPSGLPEFRVDYDHDETKNQRKKDRIALGTIYKPSKILRIKLDFRHEHTDYTDLSEPDIDDINMNGEIKFNHTLSTRSPVKMEISYKIETLYQEELQVNPSVKQDEFLQTFRGKLSYRPTKKTDISLEYQNKAKDDRKQSGEDKTDQDMKFDISQNLTSWLDVRGWIRKESKEEQDPNAKTDIKKTTLNGHIRAVPKKWLQLNLKMIDEESEETDPKEKEKKTEKKILEAALRSDFPNLFRSYQTLDFKRVNEDKLESSVSEEKRLIWKWSFSPVEDLSLKPEFIRSATNKIDSQTKDITKDITKEYKLNLGYEFRVNEIWTVNLSHITSRKRVETRPDSSSNRKEKNDDSTLEIDLEPYESLFITSQITRKDYRIIGGDDSSTSEEMSYSLKFDWSFMPFTWSNSYKYDDKKQQNDTESFESKILYDITDYTIEVEYKFTQTFRIPKDREDVVTLRFKAVF